MLKIIEVVLNEPNKLIKIQVPEGAKSVAFQTRNMPAPKPKGERPGSTPGKGVSENRSVEVPVLYLEVHALGTPREEVRQFVIANTDEDASACVLPGCSIKYVGTTQLYGGSVVLHLFEVRRVG